MQKQRVHHFFNHCFASWARIVVAVGKFEFAIAAHDLVLFFGCHHPGAFAATDKAGEREIKMPLWTGVPFSTKQSLDAIKFRLRNHWLMLSLIPLATSGGVFKSAVIEGFGESLVDAASGQWFAAHAPGWSCAKAPICVGNF